MKDDGFWENLVSGATGLPMSGGVHLTIQLETKAEKDQESGTWKETEYSILAVEDWTPGPSQASLKLD